jgi:hypothetical protein
MNLQKIFGKAILFIAMALLAGCRIGGGESPDVGEIQARPSTTIMTGQTANLSVPVSGSASTFEWSAQHGKLSDSSQPAVSYTAPDTPVLDTVTVKVKYDGGEIIRNITFEVVAAPTPTVTETALPAATATATLAPAPTATLEPIACDVRLTTRDLFPQIYKEFGLEGQFPTYGPVPGNAGSENYSCEVVSDILHNGPAAVHIKYEKVTDNSGWWGIATPNGYDASQHNQFCFWAYAKEPASFRVKMKDTSLKEEGYVVTIETPNEWKQICTDITMFEGMGVNTKQMDNVNLGFEAPWDSAEVWVTDLEFK